MTRTSETAYILTIQ